MQPEDFPAPSAKVFDRFYARQVGCLGNPGDSEHFYGMVCGGPFFRPLVMGFEVIGRRMDELHTRYISSNPRSRKLEILGKAQVFEIFAGVGLAAIDYASPQVFY